MSSGGARVVAVHGCAGRPVGCCVSGSRMSGMGLVIEPRELPPARLASELGRSAARAALGSGRFTSVRRGALVPAIDTDNEWVAQEAQALAKIASVARKLTNGAAISHVSAALVHGLWVVQMPAKPQVTQATKQNSHGRTTLKRHCSPLPAKDVTTIGGLRVTTLERTIADCAKTIHPRDALAVADSGMRALTRTDRFQRDIDAPRVAQLRTCLLAAVDEGPPRGRRQARAVIAAADPYAESPPESSLRWIAVSRGLPAPITQMVVRTRGGTFYADLGWRWVVRNADGTEEVVVLLLEYDGELKYLPGGGLVVGGADASHTVLAEKQREDLIREDRCTTVLRFTRHDLRVPDAAFARIFAAVPAAIRATLDPIPELLVGTARLANRVSK